MKIKKSDTLKGFKIYLLILINLLPILAISQKVKDSFEINEPAYKGYILALNPYYKDSTKKYYRTSPKEVKKAEGYLKTYLDAFCKNPIAFFDSADCPVIKKQFKKYYRQYESYILVKNGHHYIYIFCISSEYQEVIKKRKDSIKKALTQDVANGGTIYFHAIIDLDTGVVDFYDNGWG